MNNITIAHANIEGKIVTADINFDMRTITIDLNRSTYKLDDMGEKFDEITRDLSDIRYAIEVTLSGLIAPAKDKEAQA